MHDITCVKYRVSLRVSLAEDAYLEWPSGTENLSVLQVTLETLHQTWSPPPLPGLNGLLAGCFIRKVCSGLPEPDVAEADAIIVGG